jgi:hypothetical protein
MKQKTTKTKDMTAFKITNVLISGTVVGKKITSQGNPESRVKVIAHTSEKEFNKEVTKLEKDGFKPVLQDGAHKMTHGFFEKLSTENVVKDIQTYVKQELYENGKWREMIPNKEGDHVEVTSAEKKWTTAMEIIVWAIIGAIVGGIAYLSKGIWW